MQMTRDFWVTPPGSHCCSVSKAIFSHDVATLIVATSFLDDSTPLSLSHSLTWPDVHMYSGWGFTKTTGNLCILHAAIKGWGLMQTHYLWSKNIVWTEHCIEPEDPKRTVLASANLRRSKCCGVDSSYGEDRWSWQISVGRTWRVLQGTANG